MPQSAFHERRMLICVQTLYFTDHYDMTCAEQKWWHSSFLSDEGNVTQPQPLTEGACNTSLKEITNLPLCFRRFRWLVSTCKEGWKAYYRQPVFLAGMGLAFLYTTVLGFDCITTGYAYTQGISGSLLSLLMGVSAITGLMGTVMFTRLRKTYGLVNTGIISSCIHLGCLLLCVCSVFAPGSPMDLSLLMPYITSNSSSELGGIISQRQKHTYPLRGGSNQPLLPDRSSIHWTNNTVLFENVPSGTVPESYISIILLFLGVITARIGEQTKLTAFNGHQNLNEYIFLVHGNAYILPLYFFLMNILFFMSILNVKLKCKNMLKVGQCCYCIVYPLEGTVHKYTLQIMTH